MATVPLSYTNELLYYHFCVKAASVIQICVRKARLACVAPSLVCSNVEVDGVLRFICCHGGTVLWMVGRKEGIKVSIWKDSVVIIQMVVGYGFCVDVESFNSVKVGSFFVAVLYLHIFVHRAKGMAFFTKVFCEAVGLVIATNCHIVLFMTVCIYRYTHTTALYYCSAGFCNSSFLHCFQSTAFFVHFTDHFLCNP